MSEPLCRICGKNEIAAAHLGAPGGHKFESGILHTANSPFVIDNKQNFELRWTAPGLMRVKVEDRPNMPQFGAFVGLLLDERGDTQVVVRLDHYGLMLKAVHPSKVTPITPEEEANYK